MRTDPAAPARSPADNATQRHPRYVAAALASLLAFALLAATTVSALSYGVLLLPLTLVALALAGRLSAPLPSRHAWLVAASTGVIALGALSVMLARA